MPNIHPTAIVSPKAQLADDVAVGAYAIIEDDVTVGAGTRIDHHAIIRRYTRMGRDNFVDAFAVLGSWPQVLKFTVDVPSYLKIGDGNTFREGVTVSRSM